MVRVESPISRHADYSNFKLWGGFRYLFGKVCLLYSIDEAISEALFINRLTNNLNILYFFHNHYRHPQLVFY